MQYVLLHSTFMSHQTANSWIYSLSLKNKNTELLKHDMKHIKLTAQIYCQNMSVANNSHSIRQFKVWQNTHLNILPH
jgi:hypothetical protein